MQALQETLLPSASASCDSYHALAWQSPSQLVQPNSMPVTMSAMCQCVHGPPLPCRSCHIMPAACLPACLPAFMMMLLHHQVSGHGRFSPFQPFVTCPPGMPLHRDGGAGDGGKWICGLAALQAPCVVLSLGSNNDYSFEVRRGAGVVDGGGLGRPALPPAAGGRRAAAIWRMPVVHAMQSCRHSRVAFIGTTGGTRRLQLNASRRCWWWWCAC